ncbi:MAG TPA: molybdate ABC transporter substrate-binding protein [Stellaceae bacterium]|nr:molybdate ABC transporter substrate-binding protein [Stellaceae bacterium]
MILRPLLHGLVGFALVAGAALVAPAASAADLLVFAAASLKNALDDADDAYRQQTGTTVTAAYAASGPLAKQIENGAPADLFISADLDWMDYAQGKGLIRPDTRLNLLGNRLVLVAPKTATIPAGDIKPGYPLVALLGDGRLAIGDPQSVPAGKYAQAALEKLGLWSQVAEHTARAESVRAALVLVGRDEAPLGIVYETDAAAEPAVKIVGVFPEDSHPPIIYPIAITASSQKPEATAFIAWLRSPAAAPAFRKQGFQVLP